MPLGVAVVAAGEMGAAVAARLVKHGLSVYTTLEGRSNATRKRAADAGIQDIPFDELASRAEWVLSILPPSEAFTFAQRFVNTTISSAIRKDKLVFVDCNAVSPKTTKRIASLFEPTFIRFVDAGIIGGPPSDTYNPTIYASAEKEDEDVLDEFARFNDFGLKISPLKGDGLAGVGDASALKMSYAVSYIFTELKLLWIYLFIRVNKGHNKRHHWNLQHDDSWSVSTCFLQCHNSRHTSISRTQCIACNIICSTCRAARISATASPKTLSFSSRYDSKSVPMGWRNGGNIRLCWRWRGRRIQRSCGALQTYRRFTREGGPHARRCRNFASIFRKGEGRS